MQATLGLCGEIGLQWQMGKGVGMGGSQIYIFLSNLFGG